uniref:MFS transporter n=1 Tax=Flavonifractor plautii TaxID=292800 RepID=UPI003D7D8773
AGTLSDFWGRRRPMLLGPLFGLVAIPFVGLSNALIWVFAAKLCQGLSAGISTPPLLSVLADAAGEDHARRGRVMAFFEAATILGL